MRIDPCSVNTFFNENLWNVTVWLGCEQHGRLFGNYWLLIVFVQRNARQKKRPRWASWRSDELLIGGLMHTHGTS
ncbi:hypothetical protein FHN83_18115 [Leclercia adecarboxylata]|nr:hypothetical protein FHN83_18115 [Leclercia adecarboxylata]